MEKIKLKCCVCGTRRPLTKEEESMMKNLSCTCGIRLKVVGKRFGLSDWYYRTEPEDESLDF